MTTLPSRLLTIDRREPNLALRYVYNTCFDDPTSFSSIMSLMPQHEEYYVHYMSTLALMKTSVLWSSMFDFPRLDHNQEIHLFRKMNFLWHVIYFRQSMPVICDINLSRTLIPESDLKQQAVDIRTLLANANMRLILYIAKRYKENNIDFHDLVHEGYLVLLKAVSQFDYSKSTRFSSYTCRALKNCYNTMVKRQHKHTVWQDATEEERSEIGPSTAEQGEILLLVEKIPQLLDCLTNEERKLVCMNFGLQGYEKSSLHEIKNDTDFFKGKLSNGAISQTMARIIIKLRALINRFSTDSN